MLQALMQIAIVYGLGCFFAGASCMLLAYQMYRIWQRRTGQGSQADTGKIVAFRPRDDNLV